MPAPENTGTNHESGAAGDWPDKRQPRFTADSLATGLSLLLVLTLVQRIVGFGRNILFCRWLTPEELGRWNLAFSLLILAAPLVVIGLPGSFGRYVEHYRSKGQLKSFLRRTTLLTVLLSMLGIGALCTFRQAAAWMFFGSSEHTTILLVTLAGLVAVVGFNFLIELFMALRQVRTVSYMQFSNGVLFAVFGLALIHYWGPSAYAIIIGYALACLVSCTAAIIPLVSNLRNIQDVGQPPAQSSLWAKLIPFAAWIWFSDLLGNLFAAADRYMIVHFSSADPQAATEVVGQYHSSLVVPALILSIANMIASVVLPYMAADWESGRRQAVSNRVNMALKSFGLLGLSAGVVVLGFSSWIFGWALGGKYDDGLAVLPWTLAFCVWAGMSVIARIYLLCIERAGAATAGPLIGLVVNIGLNALLLPHFGLLGAVWATAAGNAVTLLIMLRFGARAGLKIELGTIIVGCLPMCLTFGAPVAMGLLVGILFISVQRNWLFSAEHKSHFQRVAEEKYAAFCLPIWQRLKKPTT